MHAWHRLEPYDAQRLTCAAVLLLFCQSLLETEASSPGLRAMSKTLSSQAIGHGIRKHLAEVSIPHGLGPASDSFGMPGQGQALPPRL